MSATGRKRTLAARPIAGEDAAMLGCNPRRPIRVKLSEQSLLLCEPPQALVALSPRRRFLLNPKSNS